MPEAISTQNLVTLPITSQELGRGAFLPPPNQNGTIKNPNHYRVDVSALRRIYEEHVVFLVNRSHKYCGASS